MADALRLPRVTVDHFLLLMIATVLLVSVPLYRHIDRNIGFVRLPSRSKSGSDNAAGRLVNLSRDVKIKREDDLDWSAAKESEEVYQNDLVRTLASAQAEIHLQSGDSLSGIVTVAGNSLVRVQAPEQKMLSSNQSSTIEVQEGDVRLKVGGSANRGSVVIKTEDGSEIRIQQQRVVGVADQESIKVPNNAALGQTEEVDVTVSSEKGKGTRIEAHSGAVEIHSGGQSMVLEAGEALQVEESGETTRTVVDQAVVRERIIRKLGKVRPIEPGDSISSKNRKPIFAWEPISAADAYDIEIDRDSISEIRTRVQTTRFTPGQDLAPGSYTWRVRAVTSGGIEGPFSENLKFEIKAPEPPKLQITDFNWE